MSDSRQQWILKFLVVIVMVMMVFAPSCQAKNFPSSSVTVADSIPVINTTSVQYLSQLNGNVAVWSESVFIPTNTEIRQIHRDTNTLKKTFNLRGLYDPLNGAPTIAADNSGCLYVFINTNFSLLLVNASSMNLMKQITVKSLKTSYTILASPVMNGLLVLYNTEQAITLYSNGTIINILKNDFGGMLITDENELLTLANINDTQQMARFDLFTGSLIGSTPFTNTKGNRNSRHRYYSPRSFSAGVFDVYDYYNGEFLMSFIIPYLTDGDSTSSFFVKNDNIYVSSSNSPLLVIIDGWTAQPLAILGEYSLPGQLGLKLFYDSYSDELLTLGLQLQSAASFDIITTTPVIDRIFDLPSTLVNQQPGYAFKFIYSDNQGNVYIHADSQPGGSGNAQLVSYDLTGQYLDTTIDLGITAGISMIDERTNEIVMISYDQPDGNNLFNFINLSNNSISRSQSQPTMLGLSEDSTLVIDSHGNLWVSCVYYPAIKLIDRQSLKVIKEFNPPSSFATFTLDSEDCLYVQADRNLIWHYDFFNNEVIANFTLSLINSNDIPIGGLTVKNNNNDGSKTIIVSLVTNTYYSIIPAGIAQWKYLPNTSSEQKKKLKKLNVEMF